MLIAGTVPAYAQQPCSSDAQCGDGIACTRDECVGIVNRTCQHIDICPDSTFCDGTETCCTSVSGCGTVPRGSCEQPPPVQCPPGEFCSESLDRCAECTSAFHCNDSNSCTTDVCQTDGTCAHNPVTDGTSCTITGQCVETATCQGGICSGVPVDCQAVAPPCKIGNCNTLTGQCQFVNAPNGTSCFDDNNCTAVDKCLNGVCVGGPANGCVDLRFRMGQSSVNVGDVVDVNLYADANGCTGGMVGCPTGTQPLAGVEVVLSWNATYLELANPAQIGEFNPEGPCTTSTQCDALCGPEVPCNLTTQQCAAPATCDFTCGANVFDTYQWGTVSYPKDCANGDQINAPCPSGFPANDGDAYLLAQQQFQCGGEAGDPACAASTGDGLLVATLKFRAIRATNGVTSPAPVQMQTCIQQTRTLVSDGATPGHDVLRSVPASPVTVTINCRNDGDCPSGRSCSGGSCQACPAPTLRAVGSRYLEIIPAAGTTPVGLRVVGQDSAVACINGYVQINGTVGAVPQFRTPTEWMSMPGDPLDNPSRPEIALRDNDLVAGMTYAVQTDCDPAQPGTALSPAVTAKLWRGGDVDNNNVVDIIDATRILDGFRGTYHTIACTSDANCSNVLPYRDCDEAVGRCRWVYFENCDIIGAPGCQPERSITILDVTTSLDFFRSRPDACRTVCP